MSLFDNVFIAIHLVLARRIMVTHFDVDLNPTVPIRLLKEELSPQANFIHRMGEKYVWYEYSTPKPRYSIEVLRTFVHLKDEKKKLHLHVSASQQEWFYHNIPIRDEESLESVGVVHRSIVEVRPVPGVPHGHHGGRASSSAVFSEDYR